MKKEKLRWHFRQITQLMQEGRLEEATPEMEAEELSYDAEWEGILTAEHGLDIRIPQIGAQLLLNFIHTYTIQAAPRNLTKCVSTCIHSVNQMMYLCCPEELYPEHESSDNNGSDPSMMEGSLGQPTAEALAEEMEQEEEEVTARKLSIVQEEDEEKEHGEEDDEDEAEEEEGEREDDSEEEEEEAEKRQLLCPRSSQSATERKQERLCLKMNKDRQGHSKGKKRISFSEQKDVYHYPKEDSYEEEGEDEGEGMEVEEEGEADEDDPVMEAESLQFSRECCSNPEEEAEQDGEECLLMSASEEGDSQIYTDSPKEDGAIVLRMRNRRET